MISKPRVNSQLMVKPQLMVKLQPEPMLEPIARFVLKNLQALVQRKGKVSGR